MFLNHFDALISKIIFKKYYFDTFTRKKHFEKQPQPHSQIRFSLKNYPMGFKKKIHKKLVSSFF
jgi:hypothetical protein